MRTSESMVLVIIFWFCKAGLKTNVENGIHIDSDL